MGPDTLTTTITNEVLLDKYNKTENRGFYINSSEVSSPCVMMYHYQIQKLIEVQV